eukprot:1761878-Alexandrium_andersonii.AAC.1
MVSGIPDAVHGSCACLLGEVRLGFSGDVHPGRPSTLPWGVWRKSTRKTRENTFGPVCSKSGAFVPRDFQGSW